MIQLKLDSNLQARFGPFAGSFHMALDRFVYESELSEPVLRLYWFERPCLTFGISQKPRELLADNHPEDLDYSLRISGGKCLLHESGLTYTFAWPRKSYPELEGLVPSYKILTELILESLKSFDSKLKMQCDSKFQEKANPVCFLEHKVETISREGAKIVGSAQKRGRKNCLQHGEIRLFDTKTSLGNSLKSGQVEEFEEASIERIGSLFNRSVEDSSSLFEARQEVASQLLKGFQKRFGKSRENSLESSLVREVQEYQKLLHIPLGEQPAKEVCP